MAVPKRRQSKSRSRKRNSHNAVRPRQLAKCSQCGTMVPTHVVCPTCGFYQGRVLVDDTEE
ncbi:MAG: 50S ribosomal protein L32 [Planctomyces sp.]|nr:50S ribosomal protein L32 [Planctomyces sp.]